MTRDMFGQNINSLILVYCFKVVRFTAAGLHVAKWCKMDQNGHHTPMLCSRLVELVRPGRCASRNQAEVRAALHLEVVWYEATWEMALPGSTTELEGSTWINTSWIENRHRNGCPVDISWSWQGANIHPTEISHLQNPVTHSTGLVDVLKKSRDGSCTMLYQHKE